MRAIDTNVLVRLIVRDDVKQAVAADEFVEAGAWVSHVVLVETVWVLESVYERRPQTIAGAVSALLDHEQLTLQDADTVTAALARYRRRPSVGFSDCLILEIARKAGHVPLGTFDAGLGKFDDAQRI